MKIEAFFSGIKNANEAVQTLRNAGFSKSFSDLNESARFGGNLYPVHSGAYNAPSLSNLVMNSDYAVYNPEKGPLMAASPMVSGMGSTGEMQSANYKVVVETDDANIANAEQIIRSMGGQIR
jgi:hypothetical protein